MFGDNPERTVRTPGRSSAELVFSDDGVDLTLIRWMLSLTPAERLQVLQDNVNSILKLRDDKT
jgi:hypothetical protein